MNHPKPPVLPLMLSAVEPGLRQALAQEGIPHAEHGTPGEAGRFVLFDASLGECPALASGQVSVDVNRLRRGWSHDPFALLCDSRCGRFGWQMANRTVHEQVARVDKRAVRRRLMRGLQLAIEAAGGLWLKLSAFPWPYRGAFGFRIDHDEYDAGDFAATVTAIEGFEHAVSHYVCGSTHAREAAALSRLQGQHVGSHGYWHHTYRQAADNVTNIRRGVDAIRGAGLEPLGFVAPHGKWNSDLPVVLESLGISHSSEFGLAFDERPFLAAQTNVLQVPIHPLCLGIALEAAGGSEVDRCAVANQVLTHFRDVVDANWPAREPTFLYGHPQGRLGRYPHVLREILQHSAQMPGMWMTSLAGFAQWWRARLSATLHVDWDGTEAIVRLREPPSGFQLALECSRGDRFATIPLENHPLRFVPDNLPMSPSPVVERGLPQRFAAREGLRAALKRCLDWERTTPLSEINRNSWRGWAKYRLRSIRR